MFDIVAANLHAVTRRTVSTVLVLLALMQISVVWAGDPYLDALAAEAEKIGHMNDGDAEGPSAETVGEGFTPGLDRNAFSDEMATKHPGGNVLFVQLSPQERDKIYSEYYVVGASYDEVVATMDKWLQSR